MNEAIVKELKGHAHFAVREPGPTEASPRLLDGDETELANTYDTIYDIARSAHALHVRKRIYEADGETPPRSCLAPVLI
jgi:hypothetical protein